MKTWAQQVVITKLTNLRVLVMRAMGDITRETVFQVNRIYLLRNEL